MTVTGMITMKCPECSEFHDILISQCPTCASYDSEKGLPIHHHLPHGVTDGDALQGKSKESTPPVAKKIGYAILSLTIVGVALFALLSRQDEEPAKRTPQTISLTPTPLTETSLFRTKKVNQEAKVVHMEFTASDKKEEPPKKSIPQPHGLVQLCNDWLFYRKMIAQAKEEGNASKLTEYQDALEIVNSWLSDYKEDEVQAVMVKIDKDSVFARSEEKQE